MKQYFGTIDDKGKHHLRTYNDPDEIIGAWIAKANRWVTKPFSAKNESDAQTKLDTLIDEYKNGKTKIEDVSFKPK